MAGLPLENKVIVIIGGTSGIGLSAAKAGISSGARILVTGLDEASVGKAGEEFGDQALVLQSDARDPESAKNAVQKAVDTWGTLHGLYHVAGGSGRKQGDGPLHEISLEGWQYTLAINLDSVFYSNRAAVQQFILQQSRGSILNLTSVTAYSPSPHFFATHAYSAAKSAIIGMVKSCASYYAAYNIRFNAIAPGLIHTPMSARAANNPAIMNYIATKQPLDGGRIGYPADLDQAAIFFLSDASRFVTGQVLTVDGGWSVSEGQIRQTENSSS